MPRKGLSLLPCRVPCAVCRVPCAVCRVPCAVCRVPWRELTGVRIRLINWTNRIITGAAPTAWANALTEYRFCKILQTQPLASLSSTGVDHGGPRSGISLVRRPVRGLRLGDQYSILVVPFEWRSNRSCVMALERTDALVRHGRCCQVVADTVSQGYLPSQSPAGARRRRWARPAPEPEG